LCNKYQIYYNQDCNNKNLPNIITKISSDYNSTNYQINHLINDVCQGIEENYKNEIICNNKQISLDTIYKLLESYQEYIYTIKSYNEDFCEYLDNHLCQIPYGKDNLEYQLTLIDILFTEIKTEHNNLKLNLNFINTTSINTITGLNNYIIQLKQQIEDEKSDNKNLNNNINILEDNINNLNNNITNLTNTIDLLNNNITELKDKDCFPYIHVDANICYNFMLHHYKKRNLNIKDLCEFQFFRSKKGCIYTKNARSHLMNCDELKHFPLNNHQSFQTHIDTSRDILEEMNSLFGDVHKYRFIFYSGEMNNKNGIKFNPFRYEKDILELKKNNEYEDVYENFNDDENRRHVYYFGNKADDYNEIFSRKSIENTIYKNRYMCAFDFNPCFKTDNPCLSPKARWEFIIDTNDCACICRKYKQFFKQEYPIRDYPTSGIEISETIKYDIGNYYLECAD
jgi:cell division protein FtsB